MPSFISTMFENFSLKLKHTKCGEWAGELAKGRILASRCRRCGRKYYPPRADCTCFSDCELVEIETEGELLTYTQIHVPPEHFSESTPWGRFEPYTVGMILTGEGLRILGWILRDAESLSVGKRMKAVPKKLGEKVTIVLE